MIKRLQTIYKIIPKKFRKKYIRFSLLSILNVILDIISLAYLIPIFIILLDKSKIPLWLSNFIEINQYSIISFALFIIVTFSIKNWIQIAITNFQSRLIFEIASEISSIHMKAFLKSNYLQFQKKNTAESIQSMKIIGVDFSNHILLSLNVFFTEFSIISCILCISMFFYFWLTIGVIVGTTILLLILMFFRKKKISTINHSLKNTYTNVTSELINIVQGFLEIKSLKKESYFQGKFDTAVRDFNNQFIILNQYRKSNGKYMEILMILGLVLFLIYQYYFNTSSQNNVLLISFVAAASLKLLPSLSKIILAYTNYQSFNYTIDILSKITISSSTNLPKQFKSSLIIKDISFNYNGNKNILENIQLEVLKGSIIGISGASGTGKTTLLNIIMNMITPQNGSLFLDNCLITKKDNLFSFINYIPQHPFLFQGTIFENIVLGQSQEEIDFDRIKKLSLALELDDFFDTLPNKLKTTIDINSLRISGGQKQRIALLRALYPNPDILVLDEATNQLDYQLEQKILKYLLELKNLENKTIIMVAHTNAILEICDTHYLLKNNQLKKI